MVRSIFNWLRPIFRFIRDLFTGDICNRCMIFCRKYNNTAFSKCVILEDFIKDFKWLMRKVMWHEFHIPFWLAKKLLNNTYSNWMHFWPTAEEEEMDIVDWAIRVREEVFYFSDRWSWDRLTRVLWSYARFIEKVNEVQLMGHYAVAKPSVADEVKIGEAEDSETEDNTEGNHHIEEVKAVVETVLAETNAYDDYANECGSTAGISEFTFEDDCDYFTDSIRGNDKGYDEMNDIGDVNDCGTVVLSAVDVPIDDADEVDEDKVNKELNKIIEEVNQY